MHGDPPERIRAKISDMRARREKLNLPPMQFGVADTPSFAIQKRKPKRNSLALPTSKLPRPDTITINNG